MAPGPEDGPEDHPEDVKRCREPCYGVDGPSSSRGWTGDQLSRSRTAGTGGGALAICCFPRDPMTPADSIMAPLCEKGWGGEDFDVKCFTEYG